MSTTRKLECSGIGPSTGEVISAIREMLDPTPGGPKHISMFGNSLRTYPVEFIRVETESRPRPTSNIYGVLNYKHDIDGPDKEELHGKEVKIINYNPSRKTADLFEIID